MSNEELMGYEELATEAVTLDCVVIGDNQDGEPVLLYPISKRGDVVRVDTFQDNGWIRSNYFHEDGTVEEMFRKDGAL